MFLTGLGGLEELEKQKRKLWEYARDNGTLDPMYEVTIEAEISGGGTALFTEICSCDPEVSKGDIYYGRHPVVDVREISVEERLEKEI